MSKHRPAQKRPLKARRRKNQADQGDAKARRSSRQYVDLDGERLIESTIEVTLDRLQSGSPRANPLPREVAAKLDEEITLAGGEDGYLRLMRDLWRARARLIFRKSRKRSGQAQLTNTHRRRLILIQRNLTAAVQCLSADDFAVGQLLGWPADVRELIGSLSQIADAARNHLASAAGVPVAHRQADEAVAEFYGDVVAALQAAGERCSVARGGIVSNVAAILLKTTRYPAPRDPLRHIAKAVATQPAHLAKRKARIGNLSISD